MKKGYTYKTLPTLNLQEATLNGKNPFAGQLLYGFCSRTTSGGLTISWDMVVLNENVTGNYYMVRTYGGKTVKLKKKLLKEQYRNLFNS